MLWTIVLLCVLKSACGGEDVESKVVTTKQGAVRGYKSPEGDFYVFYGVPYATVPTGSQRFQAPLLPPVRLDIFEAVNSKIVCPQFNYFGSIHGYKDVKENCLISNIYVPETDEKNLPVLVIVHGGGYALGFGEFTTPKHIMKKKKTIIVNFNYRLGPHGFLCLGTKDVPGNAGMKDQVALLRWIKDNISEFGGNPDDVTIGGCSAGASSVDLLMLSKMANGLFNKVIPESGANTATFTIQGDPNENAKKYAKQLNFSNVDEIYALEEFYKTASFDLLTSIDLLEHSTDGTVLFSPCIERDIGVERFLDDSPINILKSGNYQKHPMLYGFAKMEGIFRLKIFEETKKMMNTKFSDFLPANLQFESEDEKDRVAEKVKKFYFGTKPVNEDTVIEYIKYFTDIMFGYSTALSVRLQVEAGNNQIYLYEYAFADESSPLIPYIGIHGADHCAQTWAVQDGLNLTHNDESLASEGYKTMKRISRDMWLNFVTIGEPVPKGSSLPTWPPTGPNAAPYMILDSVLELKETPILENRMQLWDEIYSQHYRQPVPPKKPQELKTEL